MLVLPAGAVELDKSEGKIMHGKISWSPQIKQSKIRRLYPNDALGAVDEVLVEDVGRGR